jgi:hypothetical protein
VAKIETVEEFCAFCRRAAGEAGLEGADGARLERALQRYRRGLKSHLWQIAMRAASGTDGGEAPPELERLTALFEADPSSFAPLVRLSAWLRRNTGLNLESSRWYRESTRRVRLAAARLLGSTDRGPR